MIEINLLPDNLKKKRSVKTSGSENKISLFKADFVAIGTSAAIFLIAIHVILQIFIFIQYAQFKKVKSQWEKISPQKQNVDRVINELRTLQAKGKSIEQLKIGQDVLWSRKFNQISDSIARGVWIKKILLKENAMLIEGSAISQDKDGMISVHGFASTLKNQKDFLNDFASFEVDSIQRHRVNNVEISDFWIKAKLK